MRRCSDVHLSTLSDDPYLEPYLGIIRRRQKLAHAMQSRLTCDGMTLNEFANGHEYFGLHRREGSWIFREWAPNAKDIFLTGTFCDWQEKPEFQLTRINEQGTWELVLDGDRLQHGDLYRLRVHWPGGQGDRIPAHARRVVQDETSKIFNAQVWAPASPFTWKNDEYTMPVSPLIYEAHVGMAQEREGVGTYTEFMQNILPRVVDAGYNTLQLMAIMEHPYYGSFGYQVSNFFAASSRFGTPEELKALIDAAHGMGLVVIMDLVHSHAVNNEVEGLSRFDGTLYQYFHEGERGRHLAWDSRCFDYGKPEVLHFLLSNCRFWLDEYHFDGFRFDGITSMLYRHHGLGTSFSSYDDYFDESVDEEAIAYLTLANALVHSVRSNVITIAEDVSGMPGLAAPLEDGGCGFDYRLAMGVPDCWFKLVNDVNDENWNMGYLWHELINRRAEERTISYTECHDQALVGGKSLIFELIDADIYSGMHIGHSNIAVDRGMALHKMIRLATIATGSCGYLNFMGNEFGHPEWIDFPREGNSWSYHYARRQWHLRDDVDLKYRFLADFDRAMLKVVDENRIIVKAQARMLALCENDKVLVFERDGLFFFFNFHPSHSLADYTVATPPGEYQLVLDTDEVQFGGQDRLQSGQHYFTQPVKDGRELKHWLHVYLPCRTALVLSKCLHADGRMS